MNVADSPAPPPSRSWWLLLGLLKRELRDRYAGTAAGLGWALLQPMLMLGLYAFVFAFIFRIRLPGSDGPMAYVVFVAITLWPWFLLQEGLVRGMTALRGQATLVRKTTLQRDLPVMVAVLGSAIIHLAGYVVVLVCLALAGAELRLNGLPLWLLSMSTFLALVLAAAFLLSVVQLVWRDLEHAIPPALMILFYATPILYPLSLVPVEVRGLVQGNPLAWWVERVRGALLGGALPGVADVVAFGVALLLCWLGRRFYLKVAAQAEDLL
jgi:lipopolysaccharide transport system permease protein